MRKSILALAVGGVLTAMAFSAAPASADHRWSPEFGWRTGHSRPARVVITTDGRQHYVPRRDSRRTVYVNPDGSRTVVRERPGRTVIRNPDGSRTIIRRPPPQQLVVVPRY